MITVATLGRLSAIVLSSRARAIGAAALGATVPMRWTACDIFPRLCR